MRDMLASVLRSRHPDWDNEKIGREVAFASPEDVILKKMAFYQEGGSDKHLRDIAGILKISGDSIDRSYIAAWAGKLGLDEIWAVFGREKRD